MEQINNNQEYIYEVKRLVWGPQEPFMGLQKDQKNKQKTLKAPKMHQNYQNAINT